MERGAIRRGKWSREIQRAVYQYLPLCEILADASWLDALQTRTCQKRLDHRDFTQESLALEKGTSCEWGSFETPDTIIRKLTVWCVRLYFVRVREQTACSGTLQSSVDTNDCLHKARAKNWRTVSTSATRVFIDSVAFDNRRRNMTSW